MDHRARAQEQQRLERAVGQQVEDRRGVGAGGQAARHVRELADCGVGENAFQVVLRERGQGGAEHAERGDDGQHVERGAGGEERGEEPGHDEDAGGDHGGGVDQRADRRRAGHRVGEPGVQRHLRALARHPRQQQHRGRHQRGRGHLRHLRQYVGDAETARAQAQDEDAEQEADVAQAGHEERLHRGARIAPVFPPVADEEVGAQAHDLPAHVEDQEVARVDDQQHGAGEQADERAVGGVAGVGFEVADRVDLYGQGHHGHQDAEDAGQGVGLEGQGDRDGAGDDRAVGLAGGWGGGAGEIGQA